MKAHMSTMRDSWQYLHPFILLTSSNEHFLSPRRGLLSKILVVILVSNSLWLFSGVLSNMQQTTAFTEQGPLGFVHYNGLKPQAS